MWLLKRDNLGDESNVLIPIEEVYDSDIANANNDNAICFLLQLQLWWSVATIRNFLKLWSKPEPHVISSRKTTFQGGKCLHVKELGLPEWKTQTRINGE